MAGAGVKLQAVKLLQLLDPSERDLIERALAVEGMKHNSLQQITQGQIVIFGQGFKHLQQPLLDADAGLHSLYREAKVFSHMYQCTMVPTKRARVSRQT